MLDLIAPQLRVIEIERVKKSCRACNRIVQTPAPSRPIPGSMATASLLAYILVSKFDDHLPLYPLNEIFACTGAKMPHTTMDDSSGRTMRLLLPVIERIEAHEMAHDLLNEDDTPIRVLDRSLRTPGITGQLGKGVLQGRISRPMFSTKGSGHCRHHLVSPKSLPPTGSIITCFPPFAVPVASSRPMLTRAMLGSTLRQRMAQSSSVKRRAGRICAGTSMICGSAQNRRSPARHSIALAPSTISKLRFPARSICPVCRAPGPE